MSVRANLCCNDDKFELRYQENWAERGREEGEWSQYKRRRLLRVTRKRVQGGSYTVHTSSHEHKRVEEEREEKKEDCTMREEATPPPTQCALTPSTCETTTPSIGTTPAAQACGTNDAGEAVTAAGARMRRVGSARSFRPSEVEAEASE